MVARRWHVENGTRHQAKEIAMKRLLIFSVLSALLSGCVVVPAGGYYRGDGYYHGDGYYRGHDDRGYWGYRYRDHGG
jgi:hypothetical protein